MNRVFIDGEAGTTGLQIRDRLMQREDIELVSIEPSERKNLDARIACLQEADVGILCLPDAAAVEVASRLAGTGSRLIDASTAHRVDPDWVFGFPEFSADRRDAIARAERVSNPGCYSTCAIALLHPLTSRGLLEPSALLCINAVSGYSGGGKNMIEEFETGSVQGHFAYAMTQEHKHLPEIMVYGGLSVRPVFLPSVGQFAQGMLLQIPLPGTGPERARRILSALEEHYAGSRFVSVVDAESYGSRLDPRCLNGTNRLELSVHGDPETGCLVLVAILDNLGKGASGAAVQNLNIMLGLAEDTGF